MNVGVYNDEVKEWARGTLRKTRNQVLRLCLNGAGPGSKNQTVATKEYLGEANKIIFGFPYYMIFVEKGAGRGYGGNKSGLFTRKNGSKAPTNPASMGKMGTGLRVAKPWFNPVLQDRFAELAELVSDYHGEKVSLNIQRILID